MSITEDSNTKIHYSQGAYYLAAFESQWASAVVDMVVDDHELFMLAPKSMPPLTAEKVRAWAGPGCTQMLLYHRTSPKPLGYVELNTMPSASRHLWMGHCIIRPDRRGTGLGWRMVEMVVEMAFAKCKANVLSLVVFPENQSAIRCYRSAGFEHINKETKFFASTRSEHTMLHMAINARRYRYLQRNRPQPS
jgi:ribosomal protein S18 acetylase RimI-like enzyme